MYAFCYVQMCCLDKTLTLPLFLRLVRRAVDGVRLLVAAGLHGRRQQVRRLQAGVRRQQRLRPLAGRTQGQVRRQRVRTGQLLTSMHYTGCSRIIVFNSTYKFPYLCIKFHLVWIYIS